MITHLKEERGYLAYIPGHSALREAKAGTWRQELKQRLRKNTADRLAPHGLLSLLSYIARDHMLRGDSTLSELSLPYQSPIKKMLHRLGYWSV